MALLEEVAANRYFLAPCGTADVGRANAIAQCHRELQLGIADASIVMLCERYGAMDVLTLDRRHFRSPTVHGQALTPSPGDG